MVMAGGMICLGTAAIPAKSTIKIKSSPPAKKEWISLFDGKSLKGWHGFNKTGEVKNWIAENGTLTCLDALQGDVNSDLVTDGEYGNFELSWEWKIGKASNSGLMYHVVEGPKYHTTFETGPEYQLIDDAGWPGKLEEWQKAGSDYAMTVPNDKKKLQPAGEWNTSKIIFNKGHVEHWLNGEKIVDFEAWTPEWNKKKAEGKWKDDPDYGVAKKGHIALQAHGGEVAFRNIKIKQL